MNMTKFLDSLLERASKDVKTIVLPEGEDERILAAAHFIAERKAAKLIVLGEVEEIKEYFGKKGWSMDGIEVLKPEESPKFEEYANLLYELRKAKGLSLEDARNSGAMGIFDNKYGDKVTVYTIGDVSKEICGGPHAQNTKDLGYFKITKEESSSSGVRRIKAILTD